jgi:putative flavoprotein involved in K+ transport
MGGHTPNLHQFARDGVGLLGRLIGVEGATLQLAPDLHENLAKVDKLEVDICSLIDGYIARNGLNAPTEVLPMLRDGYAVEPVTALDLRAAGVTSVIWALGYAFDFNYVHLPVFDGDGFPIQEQGVTAYAGLYFVGLPWMPKQKSGLLLGVGEQAAHVVEAIAHLRRSRG